MNTLWLVQTAIMAAPYVLCIAFTALISYGIYSIAVARSIRRISEAMRAFSEEQPIPLLHLSHTPRELQGTLDYILTLFA